MTGNVREWIDWCDRTADPPTCLALGGSFGDNDSFEGRCDFPVRHALDQSFFGVGFRCCGLGD
jgi:hypothetical protein